MHVVEAAMTFFGMHTRHAQPTKKSPRHLLSKVQQEEYFHEVLDEFLEEYVFVDRDGDHRPEVDRIQSYALHLLRRFLVLEDLRDAVREGHGERLATLCKELLLHFKSHKGFNAYAIEMLISIVQNEILLSERQANQAIWAATTNWKGGTGRNIEIDLFQEKSNMFQKGLVKSMGANKTEKAITRASKSSGGVQRIVETFDELTGVKQGSSEHAHKSNVDDELTILSDLHDLKPFSEQAGRAHRSFRNISGDPLHDLNEEELRVWLLRHNANILMGFQGDLLDDEHELSDEESDEDL